MKSRFLTLATVATSVIALAACHTVHPPAPGKYESETKTTNSSGTDINVKKTTYVSKDAHGNTSAKTTTKTTKDPEGLMNKSKSTSTTTTKY